MGSAEVEDQVAGLLAAAEAVDYIDLQRVGIYGWSYGNGIIISNACYCIPFPVMGCSLSN